jgi:alpha-glucosidase (family GH31 glycosyl hydrolase)
MLIFAKLFIAILNFYLIVSSAPTDSTTIKVDCHPDLNADQQSCEARGCLWVPSDVPGEPFCYFDSNKFAGYTVDGPVLSSSSGISANLTRLNTPTLFGNDEDKIILKVVYLSESNLEISFYPSSTSKKQEKTKWKKLWRDTAKRTAPKSSAGSDLLYDVQVQSSPNFGIKVTRKISGVVIFDTTNIPGFTISEQFLSLTTRTPTTNVYGFGEQVHRKLKHDMNWEKWGMFTRDIGSSGTIMNLYGVHPFYIGVEDDGRAHGVALVNSNAQNVELAPYPTITYRTIGGSLTFNIFLGPLPDQVVQQYTTFVGKPALPPYWALGFHLCRWGYTNMSGVETVFKRNRQAGIPQDAQWIDIDYMKTFYDFTYDNVNFNTLPNFTASLHSQNMKLILITDPGIPSTATGYQPLSDGLASNVFITDARTGKPLEGSVWPGNTFYPDFSNPNATSWWKKQVKSFHDQVPFDGLWIDMNEPSNFVVGSLTGCDNNTWNYPPFVPLNDSLIIDKTICMDAKQYGGMHYDLHNLFGFLESKATKTALDSLSNGYRTFVLSRSTFMGSGAYTAHWLGDNDSQWSDMAWSIITCLEFNFFGIPFVGADICGFNGNTNEELCTRWHQLGAFYPFSRNHNSIGNIDQDPAVWSPNSVQSTKKVLTIRYKFLPYLNSLMAAAHANGSSVMRPLFFEFNTDPLTYDIGDQFLWGSGFMVVPILTPNTTSRTAYFPTSRWFDLNTGAEVKNTQDPNSNQGHTETLTIGPYDIGLFVRGGTIIPWQEPADTAVASHENAFGLLVALDVSQYASGFLYFDDDIYEIYEGFGSDQYTFEALLKGNQYGMLIIRRPLTGYSDYGIKFDTVQVYGIFAQPSSVDVNGNQIRNSSQIQYDKTNKVLTITNLNIQFFDFTSTPIQIKWNFF